jgi:ABC-type transporter MlaC component
MLRPRLLFQSALLAGLVCVAGTARADANPQEDFVRQTQLKITQLIQQHRDADATSALDQMIDYDELTRRAFGEPCPPSLESCHDYWSELNDAQKSEVRDLLKQLIAKNQHRHLKKTKDYDVTYKGTRALGPDSRVRTEAKAKDKPREPPVEVDYVVHEVNGQYHVVDIFTEGSSTSKNYYDQFKKMLTTPDQGYPYLVRKLREKLGK